MAYKIAFYDTKPYDERSFTEANEKFGFDIRYYKGHLNMNNVVLTKGVDVVCIFVNDTADAEVIRAMADNGVKLLALRCAGYNNVDLAATAGKMKVVRVPAYSPYAVAEFTVALMLSLNRKIPRATMRTRDGNFSLHGLMGFDMHGKTAGIIGTGKIAKILIQILRGFGMNVLAYDLYPDYNFAREHQVVYCTLDELYHSSDIISLHCPLTEQTKYLINDYSISKMKDGVMIINTGRGQLIHTNALIEGIVKARLDGVNISLDTLNPEHYNRLTGSCNAGKKPSDSNLEAVLWGMRKAQKQAGISVKVNCVLMHQTREELLALAELAKDGVNVRFIELMPIGQGKEKHTLKEAEVKHILSETYGTIRPCEEKLGSGPAHYRKIDGFEGKIGFISAISHKFCSGCNRVRMTADGFLKPCLQYETGMDLRTLLRDGVSDAELKVQIETIITQKPKCHHFGEINEPERTEHRGMSEIGG